MFSSVAIAFLFSLGIGAWVYSKMSRRVGAANISSILTMVAVVFVVSFLVLLSLLKFGLNFD